MTFAADRTDAGHAPQVLGDNGYVLAWLASTLENWQAEFLHLLLLAAITTFLLTRESDDVRRDDDDLRRTVARIEQRLERLADQNGTSRPAA
jgi:hypothetical protein